MEARYLTDLEWRICHAINIYVYRNGMDGESPILVHIPPAKKKNMRTVLAAIQERVSFPVGYPSHLFKMDGKKVRHPCELEQYNNYVVSSNYDKHFKCVQYGRKRSPLLVLNRDSKHIRVLRLQNSHYRDWMMKKEAMVEERPFAPHFYPPYANENSNVKLGGQNSHSGQFGPSGSQTYRVSQQNPQGSISQKPYQQDYVVRKCDVVTDNPEAQKVIERLQKRDFPGSSCLPYPTNLPQSEPYRNKSDSINIPEPPPRHAQSLQETTADPYDKYRLPLPPSEFGKTMHCTDQVNANVCSDTRLPNESSSTSYEDLHEHNKYLLKQTRRKDKKLRKMLEKTSSLMLTKRHITPCSDGSETDFCGPTALKDMSNKDMNIKPSLRPSHLLVLPPPPPQFRDEIKLMLRNSTGVVDKISFFVSQNQP